MRMLTKKQQKQCEKLVFYGYAFTPNSDEVYIKITIQVDHGGYADIRTTAVHSNGCDLNLKHILEELGNLGDLGIDFSPDAEDQDRIAAWLAQMGESKSEPDAAA